MIPVSLITSLPWGYIGIAVTVTAIFVSGCEFGETRIQSAWNEAKSIEQQAVADQAVKVAEQAKASQSINAGVSDYVQARRAGIAGVNFAGLRQPTGSNSALSRVSFGSGGTETTTEGCISADEYNRLAADAADDALIILAWQKWYEDQEKSWPE